MCVSVLVCACTHALDIEQSAVAFWPCCAEKCQLNGTGVSVSDSVFARVFVCMCVWVCGAQLDVCVYGAGSGRWQIGTCFWWGLIGSRSGILSPLSSISRLSIFIALLLLNLFVCPVTKSLFVCQVYPVLCFSVFLILSHIIFSFSQYFLLHPSRSFFPSPLLHPIFTYLLFAAGYYNFQFV